MKIWDCKVTSQKRKIHIYKYKKCKLNNHYEMECTSNGRIHESVLYPESAFHVYICLYVLCRSADVRQHKRCSLI